MPQNLPAPIALFVFNRPDHTKKTVEALQQNSLATESEIFVFCDGAKNEEGRNKVQQVRDYVKTITGFKKVTIEESSTNKGLANSIIYGVTKIVNQFEKIIVVEDDLVTSPYFLKFMNDGLNYYEHKEKVISIHGYIHPIKNLPETFFLKGADCWGWATWKRGWDLFERDGKKLLNQLEQKNLSYEFDLDDCYHYTQMLKDQIDGKNNSWAIRWHASAFLANKLTLYPGKTLVKNIGHDGSGTHGDNFSGFNSDLNDSPVMIKEITLEENQLAKLELKKIFTPPHRKNFFTKIGYKIRKKFKKFLENPCR